MIRLAAAYSSLSITRRPAGVRARLRLIVRTAGHQPMTAVPFVEFRSETVSMSDASLRRERPCDDARPDRKVR